MEARIFQRTQSGASQLSQLKKIDHENNEETYLLDIIKTKELAITRTFYKCELIT